MPLAASPALVAPPPSARLEPRLLTPEQAAHYCGVSAYTVQAWLARGELSIIVLPSARDPRQELHKVLIDRRDLDRWIDARDRR